MEPKKRQVDKGVNGWFRYTGGKHIWECDECGAMEAHSAPILRKQGILRLASKHRCDEIDTRVRRKDTDG